MAASLPFHNPSQHVILYDVSRRRYYGLDALAEMVWRLIQRPMTQAEIAEAVARRFELEAEAVERDLPEILNILEAEGLIQVETD